MSVLLTFLLLLTGLQGSVPSVADGVLDLRRWTPSQGPVPLDGIWEFSPGICAPHREGTFPQRMPVPGFWSTGGDSAPRVASYRLRLRLPEHRPPLLALRAIRPSSQSLRVLVDGKEQGQIGVFGTSPLSAVPVFTTRPLVLQVPPGDHDLVLEVANFHSLYKGIPRPLELGTPEQLLANELRLQTFNAVLAGSLAFLALQFAVQWWSRRRQVATGLFALICLFSLMRHLVTTSCFLVDQLPWLDWEAHLRIEYLTFGTIILWVYWFTRTLFPRDLPRTILSFLQASGAAYAFFSLTAPPRLLTASVEYYQAIHLIVIPVVLRALVKAARRGESGALLYLGGFAIVAVTVINDILYALRVVQTGLWAPAGMLCLVISLAVVTSRRSASQAKELESSLEERACDLASAWERLHPGFVGHQSRVRRLAERLALHLDLPPDEVDGIRRGAGCHDAGMAELDPGLILRPGSLQPSELLRLRAHTTPEGAHSAFADSVEALILRHHHEHWDGSGYPDQLAGDRIPLGARIVAIADIWDALVHERPHRAALPLADALAQLERERGRTLDPRLLDVFLEFGIWKLTAPGRGPEAA